MDDSDDKRFEALHRELVRLTYGLVAARHLVVAMRGRDMGKLAALRDEIADLKKYHDQETEELITKVRKVKAESPAVFQRAHNYVDAEKKDVADLADDLSQLSNMIPT